MWSCGGRRVKVLVTGAGGTVGSVLMPALRDLYDVQGLDRARIRGSSFIRADMRRLRSVERAFKGVDTVVDLAADADASASFRTVLENNVPAVLNGLEAARRQGVVRYVFASSNHVTGMYERDHPYSAIVAGAYDGLDPATIPRIGTHWPIRPDGPYAIGKAVAEAACRYYAEAFGLSVICIRLGTVTRDDRPSKPRHYATMLTHRDLVELVRCAIAAPDEARYAVVYGVSDNTWRFWDISDADAVIGFRPHDNAERFRGASTEG